MSFTLSSILTITTNCTNSNKPDLINFASRAFWFENQLENTYFWKSLLKHYDAYNRSLSPPQHYFPICILTTLSLVSLSLACLSALWVNQGWVILNTSQICMCSIWYWAGLLQWVGTYVWGNLVISSLSSKCLFLKNL